MGKPMSRSSRRPLLHLKKVKATKSWRLNLKTRTDLVPDDVLALEKTKNIVNKLIKIILNEEELPKSLHWWFHSALSKKIQRPVNISQNRILIKKIGLTEEDISQQCSLHILECAQFYRNKNVLGKKFRIYFYDAIRFNLPKYLGNWIGKLILESNILIPVYKLDLETLTYPEEPEEFLDLGWVLLSDKRLTHLTTLQKYCVYLHLTKQVPLSEIAEQLQLSENKINNIFKRAYQLLAA